MGLAPCCTACKLLLTHSPSSLIDSTGESGLEPSSETDLAAADSIWHQACGTLCTVEFYTGVPAIRSLCALRST